jgi:uncharacterized FlaG/YvyC family protein
MGMESFGNVPTKESLQSRLADLQRQLETYKRRVQQAQDTPVGNLFSEATKRTAIDDHQRMVDQINAEMEEINGKLLAMDSN